MLKFEEQTLQEMAYPCRKGDGYGMIIEVRYYYSTSKKEEKVIILLDEIYKQKIELPEINLSVYEGITETDF